MNDRLAFWLLVLLALAPIPLGSNRPLLWCGYALAIGLTSAFYFGMVGYREVKLAVPVATLWPELGLWSALCAFLILQILPLGTILPISIRLPSGDMIASPQISLAPGNTYLMTLQMAGYGLFFFLVAQVSAREGRALSVLRAIFYIIAVFAGWGLLSLTQLGDTILGLPKWAYQGYATATFVNRNSFATFLALGLVTGTALLVRAVGPGAPPHTQGARAVTSLLPVAAALLVVAAALIATQSRMGLLAGLLGTASVAALAILKLPSRARAAVFAAGLGLAVLAGVFALFGAGVIERLGSSETALDVRTDLYRQVWDMIAIRPWFGYGGGAFEFAFPLVHRPPVSVDLVWDKAHSTYLSLWADLGLVAGSLPLLVVAMLLIRFLVRYWRQAELSAANLAAIGAIVVCAAHSTLDFSLEIQAVAYFFVAVLGLGFAASGSPRHGGAGMSSG